MFPLQGEKTFEVEAEGCGGAQQPEPEPERQYPLELEREAKEWKVLSMDSPENKNTSSQ
jgi:hypothetical protein